MEAFFLGCVIGNDDHLFRYQTIQLQQQGVGVLLIIRAQGRTQLPDFFFHAEALAGNIAFGMGFDGIQDVRNVSHQWIPCLKRPACRARRRAGV